eukprot:10649488-Ditylum_brightwellii.AAC.1
MEDEIDELNETIQRLEQSLDLKNQEINRINISVDKYQGMVKRLKLDLDKSKQCITKCSKHNEKAIRDGRLNGADSKPNIMVQKCLGKLIDEPDHSLGPVQGLDFGIGGLSGMVRKYEAQITELNARIHNLEPDAQGNGETVAKLKNKIIDVSVRCEQQEQS